MNLFILLFIIKISFSQIRPLIVHYDRSIYKAGPQNFKLVQGKDFNIYIANNYGLLKYNGKKWTLLVSKSKRGGRSLAIDSIGTVFWGAHGDFGYLGYDKSGKQRLVSLNNKKLRLGNIWHTVSSNHGIYFTDGQRLLRYHRDKIIELKFDDKISELISTQNKNVYLSTKRNLYHIKQNNIIKINHPFRFSTKSIIQLSNDSSILVSRKNGLFYMINDHVKQLSTAYTFEHDISTAVKLKNGNFAFATYFNGLIILNHKFEFLNSFDSDNGLTNSRIRSLNIDSQNNLWLTANDGIYKMEYPSPFSFLKSKKVSMIISLASLKNELFIGSTQGLYKSTKQDVFKDKLILVKEIPRRYIRNILTVENDVFIGAATGFYHYRNGTVKTLIKDFSTQVIKYFPKTNSLYIGGKTFVYLMVKEKPGWLIKKKYSFKAGDLLSSIEEDNEKNLWIVSNFSGIYHLDIKNSKMKQYTTIKGLKSNVGNRVLKYNNSIHFVSGAGYHIYKKDEDRFLFKKNKSGVFDEEPCQNFYVIDIGNKQFIRYDHHIGSIQLIRQKKNIDPLRRLRHTDIYTSYWDGEQIWIGNTYGNIISYKPNLTKAYYKPLQQVQLDKITVKSDSVFSFSKSSNINNTFDIRKGEISFSFSLPYYVDEVSNKFQYRLIGYDSVYSNWSHSGNTRYTNLSPGNYTFQVRAKNVLNQVTNNSSYNFNVYRPWFINWPGYFLYTVITLLFIIILVRYRMRKILKENERLESLVSDRTLKIKKQLELLNKKNEALKEMDRIKSDFFSNISHEFRTPLTMILSPLEELLSSTRDNKLKTLFQMMKKNTNRILQKINQLLELSQSNKNQISLNYSIIDFADLVKKTISMLSSILEAKNINLICDLEPGVIAIDQERMTDLLINLLTNAAKYSPNHTEVKILLDKIDTADKKGFLLVVHDQGIGISEKDLPYIFDRFYRAEQKNGHYVEGTGLGLSLVKHIVELHHGSINVVSQEKIGSRFEIFIPFINENFETAVLNYQSSSDIEDKDSLYSRSRKAEERSSRVLIVEDNCDLIRYMENELSNSYTVYTAKNGHEAIKFLKENQIDLIVSDIMMPEMNGFDLCKHLKSNKRWAYIPLILLTAKVGETDKLNALDLGADAYIAKPFKMNELTKRIDNLLNSRETLKKKYQKIFSLERKTPVPESIEEKFLKHFLSTVEKNISDPDLNVDLVAEEIGLSRVHVYTKIKELTEKSPKQIIRNFRLKHAADMLKSNSGNISEIAYKVGFRSASHFTKIFQKEYGVLPSQYKN